MVTIPSEMPQPPVIQQAASFILYAALGLVALGILIWLIIRLYRKLTYNYTVDIYEKIGDSQIQRDDKAKEVKLEGNYMFHYDKNNMYSPVIEPKFMRIRSRRWLGIFKRSNLHFSVYKIGKSIFPMEVKENPGLVPINLDQFNYMQSRITANQQKYIRKEEWKQLLPYMALGAVVIMFILGMIFWGKHVESISKYIIGSAQEVAKATLENSNSIQVIQ